MTPIQERGNTDNAMGAVAQTAARLAATLPTADIEALAQAAAQGPAALARLSSRLPTALARDACTEVASHLGTVSPALITGALIGAARAIAAERARQTIDIVWTGPASSVTTSRLTSAVVVELIDSAAEEILLVSFATRTEPSIAVALDRAVQRQVAITLLLERPDDNPHYTGTADPFPALRARRLTWPATSRPPGAAIHAKAIVIDRRTALIGSANLTGRALDHNLECGVLLRGGAEPAQICDHLLNLTVAGTLRPGT
jgi:phosphatidylserine/phosphatidylglycerophosphate/cardiolipin synthase-like enzyme